jgi:hypothetical protein
VARRPIMPNTSKEPVPKPKYLIGSIIAGNTFAGTVTNAFYAEGEWNYGVGENASTAKDDLNDGYRIGPKFIRESDVKWRQNTYRGEWEAV